jgi:hypothetical protein
MEVNEMPHGDGTGPLGLGPGTGWGMGYCAGYAYPGYYRSRGFFGRGAGYRNRYWATGIPGWQQSRWSGWYPPAGSLPGVVSEEDEATFLRREAEDMERTLVDVRKRLQELEKKSK